MYLKAVLALILTGCFLSGGCVTTRREFEDATAVSAAANKRTKKELERLFQRVDNLEYRLAQQQETLADLKAFLSKIDGKIDQKNSAVFERLSKQIAQAQRSNNESFKKLRREINAKIQEINRLLGSLSNAGTSSGGGEYQTGFTHVVAENESLWKIQRKYSEYGVTVDDIKRANNIPQDSNVIRAGQELFIPTK